jgi:hypothetical protein
MCSLRIEVKIKFQDFTQQVNLLLKEFNKTYLRRVQIKGYFFSIYHGPKAKNIASLDDDSFSYNEDSGT